MQIFEILDKLVKQEIKLNTRNKSQIKKCKNFTNVKSKNSIKGNIRRR